MGGRKGETGGRVKSLREGNKGEEGGQEMREDDKCEKGGRVTRKKVANGQACSLSPAFRPCRS